MTADFNHDGLPDLAIANAHDNTVTLLLGHSNGTFTAAGTFAVGLQPEGLVVGDFNGDQFPDLAVANEQSDDVSILLNNRAGGFFTQQRIAVGHQPISVTAADFDGDGFTDLAVANSGSNDVSILYGKAGGTFDPQQRSVIQGAPPTTGASVSFVVTADFNADGLPDLVVGNSEDPRVSIASGTGNRIKPFLPAVQYSDDTNAMYSNGALSQPSAVVVGDFNLDGRLDFATADGTANVVSVYSGLGDGHFLSGNQLQAGNETHGLVVAADDNDLNDDGHADLIAANTDGASVFLGQGAGSFQSQLPAAAGHPNAIAVGDFNNDGRPDLVVANYFDDVATNVITNQIFVLLGRGDGTYYAQSTPVNVGNFLSSMVVGDFNGDGNLDVAVTSEFEGTVIILLGNGHAGFG